MAYSATWVQPSYEADWPAPPSGLVTVHLIGDPQNNWTEVWPALSPRTVVDQITRDMDRNLLADIPAGAFQVGDAVGGPANTVTLREHKDDINLSKKWMTTLGYDKVWPVLGNHDVPRDLLGGQAWANLWDVDSPRYKVDLGSVVAYVMGPDSNNYQEGVTHASPVGPFTHANVDWLDAQLAADTRPTIIVQHAHLLGVTTGGLNTDWQWVQSTINGGVIDHEANYYRDVLDGHTHVIGMGIGHTHSYWWGYGTHPNSAGEPGPHTELLDLSTTGNTRRSIGVVDAAAVFEFSNGNMQNPAASPFVTVLDDGRTLETRWRQHDWSLWAGVPGRGRVQRVTAT